MVTTCCALVPSDMTETSKRHPARSSSASYTSIHLWDPRQARWVTGLACESVRWVWWPQLSLSHSCWPSLSLLPRTRTPDSFSTAENGPKKAATPEDACLSFLLLPKAGHKKNHCSRVVSDCLCHSVPGILRAGIMDGQAEANSGFGGRGG